MCEIVSSIIRIEDGNRAEFEVKVKMYQGSVLLIVMEVLRRNVNI